MMPTRYHKSTPIPGKKVCANNYDPIKEEEQKVVKILTKAKKSIKNKRL